MLVREGEREREREREKQYLIPWGDEEMIAVVGETEVGNAVGRWIRELAPRRRRWDGCHRRYCLLHKSITHSVCLCVCVRVRVLGFWKREGRWFWKYKSYNKNSEKGFLICMISDLNQYVWEKDIYFKFGRVRNLNSNEGHGTLAVTLIFWTSLPSFSLHFFFLI